MKKRTVTICKCGRVQGEEPNGTKVWIIPPPCFRPKPGLPVVTVVCPVCHEQPGQVCKIENGKPVVHGARESVAYNGRKIWL